MYHSGSWGVLVIFLGPLRDPLGRKDMYHSGSGGVLVIFLGPLRDPLGRRGICIIQGAGEYW